IWQQTKQSGNRGNSADAGLKSAFPFHREEVRKPLPRFTKRNASTLAPEMISLRLMISTLARLLVIICLSLCAVYNSFAGEPSNIIELWPKGAPDEKSDISEER